jgi:hypothetical protein
MRDKWDDRHTKKSTRLKILQIGVPFLLSPVLDEHAEVRRRRGSSTVEGHIDDGHGVLAIERKFCKTLVTRKGSPDVNGQILMVAKLDRTAVATESCSVY